MEVWYLTCLAFCASWCISEGGIHHALTHCCDLGKNYANSDVPCDEANHLPADLPEADARTCRKTLAICCQAQSKENECRLGMNDAEVGTCNSDRGSERQSCCEACRLGKVSASSGSCDTPLGTSPEKTFKSCCHQLLPTTTTERAKQKRDEVHSLGNLCEIEDLCAHICIPAGESYKCDCNPGYTLMADGNSCKEVSGPKSTPKKKTRCDANNPCAHKCVDTGIAIYCTCFEGYELDSDKRSCKDINECLLDHDCHGNETCVNQDGYYECVEEDNDEDYEAIDCQPGFRYSWENKVCEDVNECLLPLICLPSQKCTNTAGSFSCTEGEVVCPPGYFFKASTLDCADVDECVTGANECNRESQVCLNNKGSYTCVDKASKKSCPPGFMMHPILQICVDVDECNQEMSPCAEDELCVNEEGGHNCVKSNAVSKPATTTTTVASTTKVTPTATTTTTIKPTTTTSRPTTKVQVTSTLPTTTTKRTTPLPSTKSPRKQYVPKRPNLPSTCNVGYTFSKTSQQCEDVDECLSGAHNCDHHEECQNILGSYICNCKIGFQRDHMTNACQDINECMVGSHTCSEGYRCDNSVGSFICARVANCGTGYTLNYETSICEDNDECALGTHNCHVGGGNLICRNTHGSFRCERPYQPPQLPLARPIPVHSGRYPINYTIIASRSKQCLPGYYMDSSGACQDVDECMSNPCLPSQNCLNYNGRYKCVPKLICPAGYELNSSGEQCIDVNECIRGVHACDPSEICKNYEGFYRCECPAGHIKKGKRCVDLDECIFYQGRLCPHTADCFNTIGSYECQCKDGFTKQNNTCVDVDECKQVGICGSKCHNTMGSYKCYCGKGFTLNSDHRTCSDVDECAMFSAQVHCVGTCVNTPGSYHCGCPPGYRLGADGHTCQDIDECKSNQGNPCKAPDELCFNTRGGFECASIACPKNYVRDRHQQSRCKLDTEACRHLSECSPHLADQISFHFFNIVSNYTILDEPVKFFKMHGPQSPHSRVAFKLDVRNVKCPFGVKPGMADDFLLDRQQNSVTISIKSSIMGPQQVELTLQMQIFNHNILTNTVISKIMLYVSQYQF